MTGSESTAAGRGKTVVVVGAGVAGLTLADRLLRQGCRVEIVEREEKVGGLARSMRYGEFGFDIGPHRFHTEFPEVMELVVETLGAEYRTVQRRSAVWMFGRYLTWPLRLSALRHLPVRVIATLVRDLFARKPPQVTTFEEYVVARYGRTIYEIFFKPYTEKFLRQPCAGISPDWAATGIERAVIDKQLELADLRSLVRSLLLPRPALRFLYPSDGGIGVFSEKLAEAVVARGGTLRLGTRVEGLVVEGDRVRAVLAGGRRLPCDELVWTAPLPLLLHYLNHEPPDLSFLALLLFNYGIDHEPRVEHQWCYFGAPEIPFNRVSIPSHFNPSLAPPGQSGLCVEMSCRTDEDLWQAPERHEASVRRALVETGLLHTEGSVLRCDIHRIPQAYPIYTSDYRMKLEAALELVARYPNVHALGRGATFWYNNMDHSMRSALQLATRLESSR
ncbi:MAG: FAD-dependent oxidoreductase [Deltaproteobacteria bacterium]|jgi:protoporphyrinogen oxidase|nr:FAD-dependent oxidoreductase [Deltaproteobacteria bacterium]MBW2534358.1 FAD-dependent oxidoreductase [Deltaproteobacteria bacterium]